jgi:hypothetical protein
MVGPESSIPADRANGDLAAQSNRALAISDINKTGSTTMSVENNTGRDRQDQR